MIIQLCEDDSLLHEDGKPRLVVLMVKTDQGKTHRIPYTAQKTIEDLYQDIRGIIGASKPAEDQDVKPLEYSSAIHDLIGESDGISAPKPGAGQSPPALNKNVIEREDIVECVLVKTDDDGNELERDEQLEVGHEYRVINIMRGANKQVSMYEVLNDANGNKIRIPAFPAELKLKRKRKIKPPRPRYYQEIFSCPKCATQTAINLNPDTQKYEGACESCGTNMSMDRPKNPTS